MLCIGVAQERATAPPQAMAAPPIHFSFHPIPFVLKRDETPHRHAPETVAGRVAVFDYDNDRYQDLFVGGVHHNTLYHNSGDGTFTDITAKTGLAQPDKQVGPLWSVGATWVDVNNDGLRVAAVDANLGAPAPYLDRFMQASQAIVVTTPDWDSVDGTLMRFEKHDGQWLSVGDKFPVVVGKSGLGWDALVPAIDSNSPVKKEGDGRSPAGIFTITELGGFNSTRPNARIPYFPITENTECVDDVKSRSYNKVTNRIATPDWDSSEKMRTIDVYRLMAIVDYNDRKLRGAGSCIFLHIWSGPGRGTAGCTAMEEKDLQDIADWLDTKKHPVLVQFPAPVYQRLRKLWQLP